jgi:hypothetical protein
MEEEFEIVIFDPATDEEWSAYLTEIHRRECVLYNDLIPDKYVVDETPAGEPLFASANDEIGPETSEFVRDMVAKHSELFPELRLAYAECNGKLSFRIPMDSFNWFGDAASIDNYFLPATVSKSKLYPTVEGYSAKGIVLLHNKEYFGHVWYFTSSAYPQFCGLYGMKSSLVNVLVRSSCDTINYRKGIAKRILKDGVMKLVREEGRTKVIVPWPLPPMIPILKSLGYVEHNQKVQTSEMDFLSRYTRTSNYYTSV